MVYMTQGHKHKNQNLFNDEYEREKRNEEEDKETDCNGIEKLASSQVKNAHAAGMGVLERSNENQIQKKNENDSEADDTVY